MAEYPHALRVAHRLVYFHAGDARAYVAGKIAEAEQSHRDDQAAEWRRVGRFVDRLLSDDPMPSLTPSARRRLIVRLRRTRSLAQR